MSLAVKYRPKDFSSMVGQIFIRETLQESVKENKLVGAYLFCGPRGTGKTSTARILAKSINCLNPVNGNPCHECDICKSFMDNKLIDIIEIDAASHTGVDNIRDLIEKAQFLPNKAKYKVYIIDEVHMLSNGAFNALLKILEEPPSFVKFILATTESHKIPETILSRCQRYDFKNHDSKDIKDRLEFIAKEENIITDEKSIDFIVKNSHGGLRNAITLFEQFVINNEIKFDTIVSNLGITESSFVDDFLSKLTKNDISLINDFDSISKDGKNIKLFYKDLIYKIRDEIILNIENLSKVKELNSILMILDETYSKTKNSMDEKITLLSGLLKVITKNETIETNRHPNENNYAISNGGEKTFEVGNNKHNKNNSFDNEQTPTSKSESRQETKSNLISQNLDTNNSTLNHDDVFEIFGGNSEVEDKISENKNIFDKEVFISKIKELGGKGSLTMGLRGGSIKFDGTNLHINAPTKIALKAMQEASSNDMIIGALENLGYKNVNIKID